jgi:hypothetical protein
MVGKIYSARWLDKIIKAGPERTQVGSVLLTITFSPHVSVFLLAMMRTALFYLALGLFSPVASSILRQRDMAFTHRDESTAVYATGGTYKNFQLGYLGCTWELFKRGEYVDLSRTGYMRVRWEVENWQGVGPLYEPTFNQVVGTLLFVAGGGNFQWQDAYDGACLHGTGCVNRTGASKYGYSYFPDGSDLWINMYYYLDGSVTITNHESGGDYNVGVEPIGKYPCRTDGVLVSDDVAYANILADINTTPADKNTKYGYSYYPSEASCSCSET